MDISTYDYKLDNGIDLHVISTKKFKTIHFNIFFHRALNKDTATLNALLPRVMKRGCQGFRDTIQIERFLEDIYGAGFGADVLKKGERQIIGFRLDIVHPKYTGDDALIDKGLSFLNDIISKPLTIGEGFNQDYVEQEKQNLKDLIEGLINDKAQYAVERCIQEMCKGEPFATYVYGSTDALPGINVNNLYEYYKDVVASSPIDIFILGDVEPDAIRDKAEAIFNWSRGAVKRIPKEIIKKAVTEPKEVVERMDVLQGKLSLGLRTNTAPDDTAYPILMLYASILGGGPHSKLFLNVREKASLAYYAYARLEKYKGLMIISSGIEIENYKKALDIMLEQLDEMKRGIISSQELDFSKKALITSLRSIMDSPQQLTDYYLSNAILKKHSTIDQLIESINAAEMNQVVEIAQRINLDTIYFLANKGMKGAERI
jgi:predicted Zn-dependent peptidase